LSRAEGDPNVDAMDPDEQRGATGKKGRPIFLEDFADVERPFEEVRGRFTGDGGWLAPFASAAAQDGETLRMRIGPSWTAGRLTREVRVTLGTPHERGDALVIPLAWEPSGLRALFPVLDGDIELAPIGPGWCRVTLAASYVPPLGELGARVDHAFLHRVAASTVRSFLSRVATSLQVDGDDSAQ